MKALYPNAKQKSLIAQLQGKAEDARASFETFAELNKDHIETAFVIRCVENSFLDLFARAKLSGTVHTCIGQEFSGIAVAAALGTNDWVTSNHRCHGHFIAKTGRWQALVDELLGLSSGVCGGIGSSQHLFQPGFISNGTQGSLLPVATGMAHHQTLSDTNNIIASFIGEGTLGEGVVYEAFNLAALLNAPQLIICETNYYSQSTPTAHSLAGSIQARAEAFGLTYYETNTWDLPHLFRTVAEAVDHTRSFRKPTFIQLETYRLRAHSKGDDDRDPNEIGTFEELDPINVLKGSSSFGDLYNRIDQMVTSYVEEKLNNTDVFSLSDYKADQLPRSISVKTSSISNDRTLMRKALNNAYRKRLNEGQLFVGEDIHDPYGGAFKVTKGFHAACPEQVISTPISEAGLTGLAIGLSMLGKKTYAEIMFGDFMANAVDQLLNNASKFYHMYAKQTSAPVVIRTPMGGRRGYGPTHSQSIEKLFLGIDNLAIVSVTSLSDPTPLIDATSALKCPTLLLENKTDYGSMLWQGHPDLETRKIGGDLGTIHITPSAARPEVSIICYGHVGRLIADNFEEIFRTADTIFEIFCMQLVHPAPITHVERAVKRSKKVLLVDESSADYGWSNGMAAALVEIIPNITTKCVSALPIPIPSVESLETEILVNTDAIAKSLDELGQIA